MLINQRLHLKRFKTNFLLLTLLLTGCATIYQKEGVFSNGYSDSRISSDTFVITFRANEHTSQEDVYRFAIRRAAEMTIKHHYNYFSVLEEIHPSDRKKSKKISLHYPSIQLKIRASQEMPPNGFDARQILNQSKQ